MPNDPIRRGEWDLHLQAEAERHRSAGERFTRLEDDVDEIRRQLGDQAKAHETDLDQLRASRRMSWGEKLAALGAAAALAGLWWQAITR